jgi:preprotein translocase subunit SecG
MVWKRIIVFFLSSLFLAYLNQYSNAVVLNINYSAEFLSDGCILFSIVILLVSIFNWDNKVKEKEEHHHIE